MITDISLRGFIVGQIWQPGCGECYKPLEYSITRQNKRWGESGTLREHVVRALNDGDFKSATLAHVELVVERRSGTRRVIRSWPLARFPSVVDCIHPEGDDWCPQGGDED